MVQPSDRARSRRRRANPPVYHVGCAGRITQFAETDDGRYLITLTGVSRFRIAEELPLLSGYRRIVPRLAALSRATAERPASRRSTAPG